MLKLIEMLDKFSHQIEEKDETISELQTLLKFRTNENKSLYKEINRLREVIKIKDFNCIDLVKENGMQIITLGKRILRTETAGMTTTAILLYELD